MSVNIQKFKEIELELGEKVKMVAVSKVRTVEEIRLL